MNQNEVKDKLSLLLKQLTESGSLTLEKAQEIAIQFKDLYNQTIDPKDFNNLFSMFIEKYSELKPLTTEIVLEKTNTEEISAIRNSLKQFVKNK